MALITCIECGKKFSDRALACPECGCPTSAMTGQKDEKSVAEVVIKLDKSSEDASKQMYDAVRQAKSTASSADSAFDRASSRVQRMASRSIDLFGGTAVTQVADIAQESKKACDDLYAALQLALATLDNTCRPLLIYKPEGRAIKEVYYEIKQLNSDSEISNTFTGSLNYDNLGDLATRRYSPSIQAKMIEQFWKTEYEKVQSEMNRIEADKKAKLAEIQKKKDEEEKKKIEKFQNENKAIIDEYALKSKKSITIFSDLEKKSFDKRTNEVKKQINDEKTKIQSTIDKDTDSKINDIHIKQNRLDSEYRDNVTVNRKSINEKEEELAKLKIFDFSKKKALSSEIEMLVNRSKILTDDYKSQTSKYKKEIEDLKSKKSSSIKKELEEIDKRYPLPKMLEYKKPVVSNPTTVVQQRTPQEMVNASFKEAIYEYLLTVDLVSIVDIQENCPEVADLTNQRVSAYVRQLLSEGRVERIEDKRKAYFRAIEGYGQGSKKKIIAVNNNNSNIVSQVESLVKEGTITYKKLRSDEKHKMISLEEFEIYGALKYLAVDNAIYCEEKDNDLYIFYIDEKYRKKN